MGAWIEMTVSVGSLRWYQCRPRMGAWIEIPAASLRDRPRRVAPVWGRGLKSGNSFWVHQNNPSPPYGGVD